MARRKAAPRRIHKVMLMIVVTVLIFLALPQFVYALEIIGKEYGLRVIPPDIPLFEIAQMSPGDMIRAGLMIKNEGQAPFSFSLSMQKVDGTSGVGDLYEQLCLEFIYGGERKYKGTMSSFKSIDLGNVPRGATKELEFIVHLPGTQTGNEFQGSTLSTKFTFRASWPYPDGNGNGNGNGDGDDKGFGDEHPPGNGPDDDDKEDDQDHSRDKDEEQDKNKDEEEIIEPVDELPPSSRIPDLPATGEIHPLLFCGTGAAVLLLGIILGRKAQR